MAHALLRRLLDEHTGVPGRALLAWRTRGQAEALLAGRGLAEPGRALAARLGHRVVRGPFVGMLYPRRRGDIVHATKLLGAYEREVHVAMERLVARRPTRVVNVGSGDGYYTVGLARRLPDAEVWAVDPDPLAQRACRGTAARNGVAAQLRYASRLDARALEQVLLGSPRASATHASAVDAPAHRAAPAGATHGPARRDLCLVDCEGYEDELLDPAAAPALAHADLLVETHDFARAGVTERLAARFAGTHDVERLEIAARDPLAFPELAALPGEVARGLLDEFRHPPQSWIVLTARSHGTEP
ncbi:MAG: methyltransferase [Gemmatimonadota bacterium]|nr:methyltransferase [Gemmatimonadota bacterium]